MDFKNLSEFINEIVESRVRLRLVELENVKLHDVNTELTNKLTSVTEQLAIVTKKYEDFCVNERKDVSENGIDLTLLTEEVKHELNSSPINVIVEEKQVVIDDPVKKRKEYMRTYMKEKRNKKKDQSQ